MATNRPPSLSKCAIWHIVGPTTTSQTTNYNCDLKVRSSDSLTQRSKVLVPLLANGEEEGKEPTREKVIVAAVMTAYTPNLSGFPW